MRRVTCHKVHRGRIHCRIHCCCMSAVGRWRFPRHYDMRPLMLALTRHEPGGGPNSAAQSHTDMLRGKDILSHFIHACYMCPIGFAYVHVLRRCTTLGRMLACRCSRETTNRWDNGERETPLIACDGILCRILRVAYQVVPNASPRTTACLWAGKASGPRRLIRGQRQVVRNPRARLQVPCARAFHRSCFCQRA